MSIHPGQRIHLELRNASFVIYTDGGEQRFEVPYGDADEVIEQLTRVLGSEGYMMAGPLPANRSPTGHMLNDSPRKLSMAKGGNARPRMRFMCVHCGEAINDRKITDLSQREFGQALCPPCYIAARQKMFPGA